MDQGRPIVDRKDEALTYMEQKYGERFVEVGSQESPYWRGDDFIIVHPEGRPDELARVVVDPGPESTDKSLSDDYMRAKWSAELTKDMTPELRESLGADAVFKVAVMLAGPLPSDLATTTTLQQYRTEHPNTYAIVFAAITPASPANPPKGATRLLDVQKAVLGRGFTDAAISIGLVGDTRAFADFVSKADVLNLTWSAGPDGVNGYVSTVGVPADQVRTPEDVLGHFKSSGE
jgi:hypothetical protein